MSTFRSGGSGMAGPVQVEPGMFVNGDGEWPMGGSLHDRSMPTSPGVPMHPMAGQTLPGCPAGLEGLAQLDHVLIRQKTEMLQELVGVELNNHYVVTAPSGQPLLRVAEDSSTFQKLCCGPGRGFNLRIFSPDGREVMRVIREFVCCSGCCWCAGGDGHCSYEIRVEAPPGAQPIGFARQGQSACRVVLDILNERREEIFRVRGPCCACACCGGDVEFPVMDRSGSTAVAHISKTWGGGCREFCTSADNFTVNFPIDLDVRMKATLIGATFLIDFIAFETNQADKHNN